MWLSFKSFRISSLILFSIHHSFTHSFLPHLLSVHSESVLLAVDVVVNRQSMLCPPELLFQTHHLVVGSVTSLGQVTGPQQHHLQNAVRRADLTLAGCVSGTTPGPA